MTSAAHAFAWHHTGISVENLSHSLQFYKAAFGYEPVFEAMDMSDLIESITGVAGLRADLVQCKSELSGQILELIKFRNIPNDASDLAPIRVGRSHNAFLVPDIDFAIAEIEKTGGKLIGSITQFSEGRCAYLSDGFGNAIELEEVLEVGH